MVNGINHAVYEGNDTHDERHLGTLFQVAAFSTLHVQAHHGRLLTQLFLLLLQLNVGMPNLTATAKVIE